MLLEPRNGVQSTLRDTSDMGAKTVEQASGFLRQMGVLQTSCSGNTEIHQDVSKSIHKNGRKTLPPAVPPPGTATHPPPQRHYQHKQAVYCTNHYTATASDHPSFLDTHTQNCSLLRGGSGVGVFGRRGPGTSAPLLELTSGVGHVLIPAGVRNAASCPRSQSSRRSNGGLRCAPARRVGDVPAQWSPRSSSTMRAGVPKGPPSARGVGGWLWCVGAGWFEGYLRAFLLGISSVVFPPLLDADSLTGEHAARRVVGVGANP